MKIVLILQARMSSTRLPGKVLMEVMGRPLLDYQIERIRRSNLVNKVVLATSTNVADEKIINFAHQRDINIYAGSEFDVLDRYYSAAMKEGADIVVRCNGDCPLIDPCTIDLVVDSFLQSKSDFDYVSNILVPSFPVGLHTEVFSMDALRIAHCNAIDPLEREHVTPYIYHHPERFKLKNVSHSQDLSFHRWTLDYMEDYDLIKLFI